MAADRMAPGRDGVVGRPSFRRSARKIALLSGTAVALTFAASAAQAQCTSGFGGAFRGQNIDFGVLSSGNVSAVQSLIGVISTTSTAFQTQSNAFVSAPPNPAPGQPGGGIWVRGIGGTFDTTTPGNYNNSGSLLGPAVSGTCRTRTFQDYAGVQLGSDIARLNVNGFNVHVGVTGGYSDASVSSPTGQGRFNADFQIPFVGGYAAVTSGSFFADAQVRADFYHARLNDPSNGIFNQGLNARSFSLSGNAGYQFALPADFFIEPSAGLTYTRVNIDRFNLGGTLLLDNNPGFSPPSTARIRDFDSILARASLRFGRNFAVGNFVLQPFVTASVFNEFADRVSTTINTNLDPLFGFPAGSTGLDSTTAIQSSRIGTYGQFAAGVAGQIVDTGWLGYVRGDYRIGDRVEGFGISGGLRYQFTPEQVAAAIPIVRKGYDAPAAGPSVPVITAMNWSGFSFGGSLGGVWENVRQDLALNGFNLVLFGVPRTPQTGRVNVESAGLVVGGQVGYDFQFGSIVVGVGGDVGYVNARGSRSCPTNDNVIGVLYNCETQTDFLAMATGRVGYATERSLFYVKGGAAFGDVRERVTALSGNQSVGGSANPSVTSTNRIAFGWTAGVGYEFALTSNWSAKAEYMHYELERRRIAYPAVDVFPATTQTADHSGDLVRVGLNYRFNFGSDPVAVAPARGIVRKF